MLFCEAPPWCEIHDPIHDKWIVGRTNVSHETFQLICKEQRLKEIIESSGIDYTSAYDLLQRMLVENPKERASTDEILQHPWIREST